MSWSQGKVGSSTWYVYNATGTSRFDTANANYSNRLGEAGSADPQHNYVKDKWCIKIGLDLGYRICKMVRRK